MAIPLVWLKAEKHPGDCNWRQQTTQCPLQRHQAGQQWSTILYTLRLCGFSVVLLSLALLALHCVLFCWHAGLLCWWVSWDSWASFWLCLVSCPVNWRWVDCRCSLLLWRSLTVPGLCGFLRVAPLYLSSVCVGTCWLFFVLVLECWWAASSFSMCHYHAWASFRTHMAQLIMLRLELWVPCTDCSGCFPLARKSLRQALTTVEAPVEAPMAGEGRRNLQWTCHHGQISIKRKILDKA